MAKINYREKKTSTTFEMMCHFCGGRGWMHCEWMHIFKLCKLKSTKSRNETKKKIDRSTAQMGKKGLVDVERKYYRKLFTIVYGNFLCCFSDSIIPSLDLLLLTQTHTHSSNKPTDKNKLNYYIMRKYLQAIQLQQISWWLWN